MITHRASSKMSICQRLFWVDSYRATAGCNKFSLLSLLNQLSRSKYFFLKKYFKAFILHKSQHLPKVKSRILIINFVFYSSLSLSLSLSLSISLSLSYTPMHACAHWSSWLEYIYYAQKKVEEVYTNNNCSITNNYSNNNNNITQFKENLYTLVQYLKTFLGGKRPWRYLTSESNVMRIMV